MRRMSGVFFFIFFLLLSPFTPHPLLYLFAPFRGKRGTKKIPGWGKVQSGKGNKYIIKQKKHKNKFRTSLKEKKSKPNCDYLFYKELPFMSKVYDWFEERLEIQSIADDISSKYVPPHVNIFYCLGGITFTCFLVQVATGFAMTFYYRPTVAEAFASVQYLMTDVNFGWLIRSIHRWSASMMVLTMILHTFRVYLTGGFKKPRELTWVTGVIMAVCTVSFGVTGYSLPWDQVGYWAVKIVTGVPDAIPVVGSTIVELLRGGVGVGQSTLTRFYSLHTFVLPLATAVFMLMHFLMIRKQGISGPL